MELKIFKTLYRSQKNSTSVLETFQVRENLTTLLLIIFLGGKSRAIQELKFRNESPDTPFCYPNACFDTPDLPSSSDTPSGNIDFPPPH